MYPIRAEESKRSAQFILPIRTDNSLIPGLLPTVGYLDLRKLSVWEAATILYAKLEVRAATPVRSSARPFG